MRTPSLPNTRHRASWAAGGTSLAGRRKKLRTSTQTAKCRAKEIVSFGSRTSRVDWDHKRFHKPVDERRLSVVRVTFKTKRLTSDKDGPWLQDPCQLTKPPPSDGLGWPNMTAAQYVPAAVSSKGGREAETRKVDLTTHRSSWSYHCIARRSGDTEIYAVEMCTRSPGRPAERETMRKWRSCPRVVHSTYVHSCASCSEPQHS